MNLLGADARHREDRELHRPVDHQLAARRVLDGFDQRRLVGFDVDQIRRRREGNQQWTEKRGNRPTDSSTHGHGHNSW
jgi:hypothetical protein